MEDTYNNLTDDQFDNLSDDKLWDILDIFADDKKIEKVEQSELMCMTCNSIDLIYTANCGSYVCKNCGLESHEFFDNGPEWNNFDDKGDSSRCSMPNNAFFPKSSLGTTISTPGYSKIKMLKSWGQVPYRERSLAEVLNNIDIKCKKYKITKAVIDNAKILYRNVRETKHLDGNNKGKNVIIRGINRKQIIGACLYFGAILQKSPRSTKEVADIFDLSLKQVSKGCRKFLEIMKDNFIVFDIKPSHGIDFIERFGSKLKLSKEGIELAKTIADNTTKLGIASDHQATSIAAASILFATNVLNENINKKAISGIFKISDVTIVKTYKKILPFQQFVIDDEKTNKLCYRLKLRLLEENIDLDEIDINYTDDSNVIKTTDSNDSNDSNNSNDPDNKLIDTFNVESETEQLIKKLYSNDIITPNVIDNSIQLDLDESDIIKKDNILNKKNRLIQQELDREIKKELKNQIKQIKNNAKLALKEKKKEDREKKKSKNICINNIHDIHNIEDSTSDSPIILIKKKRGRPTKLINSQLINNL